MLSDPFVFADRSACDIIRRANNFWERSSPLETLARAHLMVDIISSKLGSDILLLDLTGVTLIADYFVIATGESARQLSAIAETLAQQLKQEQQIVPLAIEGTVNGGWVLLDFGSIVVHLFDPEQRARYNLEEFWSDARTIMRMA